MEQEDPALTSSTDTPKLQLFTEPFNANSRTRIGNLLSLSLFFLLYFKSYIQLKTNYYNPDIFTETFKIYIPEYISLCYTVGLC